MESKERTEVHSKILSAVVSTMAPEPAEEAEDQFPGLREKAFVVRS